MPAWPAPSPSFPFQAFPSQAGPHGGLQGFADPWIGPVHVSAKSLCSLVKSRIDLVFFKSEIWDALLVLPSAEI